MIQNFTVNKLLYLCKHEEWEEWGINKYELSEELDAAISEIYTGSFSLNMRCEGDIYIVCSLAHVLILRKLNDDIRKIYKVRQSNRRLIIKQAKTLLSETCPSCILKTDIKGFYENIKVDKILEKLKDDRILSYYSIELLANILSNFGGSGLPRGLSISATLSELYMRAFDRVVQRIDGVYYYARFVDDILIFTISDKIADEVQETLSDVLNTALGLELNKEKTAKFNGNEITITPLEYLGYKFNVHLDKSRLDIKISIADKKIKRIKLKIAKVFIDYIKNKDFALMTERMKLLTGNYTIRSRDNGGDLKAGIYYNYNYLNDYSALQELDKFYNRLVYSKKGSIGNKLYSMLTPLQRSKLSRYSFVFGWENKVYIAVDKERVKKLKRCWYE